MISPESDSAFRGNMRHVPISLHHNERRMNGVDRGCLQCTSWTRTFKNLEDCGIQMVPSGMRMTHQSVMCRLESHVTSGISCKVHSATKWKLHVTAVLVKPQWCMYVHIYVYTYLVRVSQGWSTIDRSWLFIIQKDVTVQTEYSRAITWEPLQSGWILRNLPSWRSDW